MNIANRIIAALLHLYPATWRNEYGSELVHVLQARPLRARIVCNVCWNGLWQRARSADAATLMGLVMMLVMLVGFVWNIVAPAPYGANVPVLLHPSTITLPTVRVSLINSEFYVLLLAWCGCWAAVHDKRTVWRSGVAAMKMSCIASIPVMLAGVLMLSGALRVIVLGPGDVATTFHQHGFAFTYYHPLHIAPGAMTVLTAPLFALPWSWMWGALGARFGLWISRGGVATASA